MRRRAVYDTMILVLVVDMVYCISMGLSILRGIRGIRGGALFARL